VSRAARARQALLHLLLDLSETGVTLAILWRCLAAFRPLALGWFPLALRPLRRWLLPVIGKPAYFTPPCCGITCLQTAACCGVGVFRRAHASPCVQLYGGGFSSAMVAWHPTTGRSGEGSIATVLAGRRRRVLRLPGRGLGGQSQPGAVPQRRRPVGRQPAGALPGGGRPGAHKATLLSTLTGVSAAQGLDAKLACLRT